MKGIRIFCRWFTGLVFVFSGFVKAIDPWGYTYKIQDYFSAFHVGFLNNLALIIAVAFSTMELLIGFNLLFSIRMKFTAWLLMLLMSYFTVLTFILAIFNPVSDCGCFGDAIILTNWQTFWKNIILMIPTIIIFLQRNQFKTSYSGALEWSLAGIFTLAGVFLSAYCFRNLPLMDFRPYAIGTYIPDKMIIPEGMPLNEYETVLVYQKNGVLKEFNIDNYPWQDTTWKWVETKQKLIKKGYVPPIHDFVISSVYGKDLTENILSDTSYSFLIIAHDLKKTNQKSYKKINKLAEQGLKKGYCFYLITSSTNEEITTFKNKNNPPYEIYTADGITLKTIIRANPGIVLIRKGTILGKWHYRNFNFKAFPDNNFDALILNNYRKIIENLRVAIVALTFLLIITGFHILNRR
jgi:hypothetical protein